MGSFGFAYAFGGTSQISYIAKVSWLFNVLGLTGFLRDISVVSYMEKACSSIAEMGQIVLEVS